MKKQGDLFTSKAAIPDLLRQSKHDAKHAKAQAALTAAFRWLPLLVVVVVLLGASSLYWLPRVVRMGWEAGAR